MKELAGILCIVALSLWLGYVFGHNWDSEDEPDTTAVVIVCEDGWHYVATNDKHYTHVLDSGVIHIHDRDEEREEPTLIINKPACSIDWHRESNEIPTPPATPSLPRGKAI